MMEQPVLKRGSARHWRQFVVLVFFRALGTLRTERKRTYLGFLWWFFEPLFLMAVFYVVFGKFFQRGGPGYVSVLLSGLVLWQWFASSIMHNSNAIQAALPLLRGVKVAPAVFPLATFVADSFKFLMVLVVLLITLVVLGHPPEWAWLSLIPILAVEGMLACGCAMIVAAIVPFVPDLRFVIAPLLQGMFFLSGVFFTMDSVSPAMRRYLELDPMAVLIDCSRAALLHGELPDPLRLGWVFLLAIVVCVIGATLLRRFAPRYPKLAS